VLGAAVLFGCSTTVAVEDQSDSVPVFDGPSTNDGTVTAVLAGGCFWSVETVFEHVRGVEDVVSGYSGGTADTAHYDLVINHQTDHAEVVRITFDPGEVSYAELLRVFFSVVHDPTEVDRQGPDIGTAYRSHIYYTGRAQQDVAEAYIDQLEANGIFPAPIATRLDPLFSFFAAEDEHQDYVARNTALPYVVLYSLPKLAKLEALFPDLYAP
jgi:peptide-methionine (S)-S-oxide reductase